VLGLLEGWGFVRDWALTDRGELLVRTYHESDLLLAEAVARGLFDDLDPPSVAALASCVTYEHRSRMPPPPPWFPSAELRGRFEELERIGRDLQGAERAADLPETRLPDPTFAGLAHAWASGTDLATVLDDEDLSGGDFVRNVRQLIDLLRQLAGSAPVRATGRAADAAADDLFRGVVAASSLIGTGVDDDEPIGDDDRPED
jgi:ATP-dependent RNA helicase HelY